MKIVRLVLLVVLAVNFIACNSASDNKKHVEEVSSPVNLSTINLDIQGMTCQIGCAKTIESKLSKLEGVTEAKVSFEKGSGVFVVDTNKTSKETLINTINSLVGGETYTAVESKEKSCKVNSEESCCVSKGKDNKADECNHKEEKSCEKPCEKKQESACSKECADRCNHKEGESCTDKCVADESQSHKADCNNLCC